jgi:hypothetical protein
MSQPFALLGFQEYWEEIAEIAASATAHSKAQDGDHGHDDASDFVAQTVDSHSFIIYYAKAQRVMMHTQNADAYCEMFGELPKVDSYWAALGPLAACAMAADVHSHSLYQPHEAECAE